MSKNRKSMVVVLFVFVVLALSQLACSLGGCDGTVDANGHCTGTFTQPDAGVNVERAVAPVSTAVHNINKTVEQVVVTAVAPQVKKSVDDIKKAPGNPFGGAVDGFSQNAEYCKAHVSAPQCP